LTRRFSFQVALGLIFLTTIMGYTVHPVGLIMADKTAGQNLQATDIDYTTLIGNLNKTNILAHATFFANLGSRVPGYPGFYSAASYIRDQLTAYGLSDVRIENYSSASPICEEGRLIVTSPETYVMKLYPLWPMGPSPTVIDGEARLIDVGSGSMSEFDGKDVKDSYVLMDFNSLWNWRNAFILGAKAVIFIEPEDTTKLEAMYKFTNVPINFPRLYISRTDGLHLRSLLKRSHVTVKVEAHMAWRSVDCPNIFARITGTDPVLQKETIALMAYYDSWSIVPLLNPGADDALSVAALLEIARIFAANPPARTVEFMVFSGHFRGVEGARHWVQEKFDTLSKYRYVFSLDLSSAGSELGVFARGSLYSYETMIENMYLELHHNFFLKYLPKMETQLKRTYKIVDAIQWSRPVAATIYESQPILLDSDPFTAACYGGGVGFHTTNAVRKRQGTPLDTLSNVNFENFWPQIELVLGLVYSICNEPYLTRMNYPIEFGRDSGVTTVTLSIAEYNMTSAWFQPFIDNRTVAIIYMTSAKITEIDSIKMSFDTHLGQVATSVSTTFTTGQIYPSGSGVKAIPPFYQWYVVKPDERGIIKVPGIKSYSVLISEAYVIDEDTGDVIYATDLGSYGAPPFPSSIAVPDKRIVHVTAAKPFKYIAMFPTATIILTGMIDPRTLASPTALQVLDAMSHGPQIWYGMTLSWPDAAVFVPSGARTEILVQSGGGLMGILVNASEARPEGCGYVAQKCSTLVLTPFHAIRDYNLLTRYRLSRLKVFYVSNPTVALYDQKSLHNYASYQELLSRKQFSDGYSFLFLAWGYLMPLYQAIMSLNLNVVVTLTFIVLMLVPFSLFVARLIGLRSGLRSVPTIIFIFFLGILLLYFVHPGFQLASNASMVLIGVSTVIMCLGVVAQSFAEVSAITSKIRQSLLGSHSSEVRRTAAVMSAVSVSIEQMRKRKLRTALTLFSLSLLVFSMVAFTSISNIIIVYPRYGIQIIPYQGMLLRNVPWEPISYYSLERIFGMFKDEAVVAARTWLYPPRQEYAFTPQRKTFIRGFLGMSASEAEVTGIHRAIINGSWFEPHDRYAIILTKSLASSLKEELGRPIVPDSIINIWGIDLLVRGIADDNVLRSIIDLDGEMLSPVDYLATAEPGQTELPHLDFKFVAILPVQLTIDTFQAPIMSIAVKFKEPRNILNQARDLSTNLDTPIYAAESKAGEEGQIFIFLPRAWFSTEGFAFLSAPMAIAAFTVLNLMLGAVYERRREISILSSVGLSPMHISSLFLTEALLHATCSSVIGYIAGIIGIRAIYLYGAVSPGFYPNYVSLVPIIAILITSAASLLSAVYPSWKASKLSVPSLERKWRLPTKPSGNRWIIPLPFTMTEKESRGVLMFLKEFLDMHRTEHVGRFWARDVALDKLVTENGILLLLKAVVRIAPFDAGIEQKVEVMGNLSPKKQVCHFSINIERIYGVESSWITSNYHFIDTLRKQFLQWRTLNEEERTKYINMAESYLGKSGGDRPE